MLLHGCGRWLWFLLLLAKEPDWKQVARGAVVAIVPDVPLLVQDRDVPGLFVRGVVKPSTQLAAHFALELDFRHHRDPNVYEPPSTDGQVVKPDVRNDLAEPGHVADHRDRVVRAFVSDHDLRDRCCRLTSLQRPY